MVLACITIIENSSLAIIGYLYLVLEVAEIDCKPAGLLQSLVKLLLKQLLDPT